VTDRELVCLCDDVTRHDVEEAVASGATDIESVKRYTGLGTGVCQGRSCMARLARVLSDLGVPPDRLAPMTARAPLWPVPLGVLSQSGELPPLFPGPERPALARPRRRPPPPPRSRRCPRRPRWSSSAAASWDWPRPTTWPPTA
jgi:bacterioferritin-associated ferredoxin